MKDLGTIKDEDFGLTSSKLRNPKVRYGARGIVEREDGKIAIFYEHERNHYKLPGGGIEGDETSEHAFEREVAEEVGCLVKDVTQVATIKEERSQANFEQNSDIYFSKLKVDLHKLSPTKEEQEAGAEMMWVTPEKAHELISGCLTELTISDYEKLYHSKFMVMRDIKIVEEFLNSNETDAIEMDR